LLHSQPAKHLFGGDIQGNHFGHGTSLPSQNCGCWFGKNAKIDRLDRLATPTDNYCEKSLAIASSAIALTVGLLRR